VVGQTADGESREQAEGAVENGDEGTGYQAAEGGGGDGEFRDEPEGVGGENGAEIGGEGVDFRSGEAVEEEVGDDQVVGGGRWGESAEVGDLGANALGVRAGSADKGAEHSRTGVDGVDVNVGVGAEQAGGEASVAVAEDKGAAAGGDFAEEGYATPLEERAEAE